MYPAAAQPQRYVSDQLEITLRRGPGTEFAIRRMLKSGTSLQVMEENGQGYANVTTTDGTSGWVLTRFLVDEPVARQRMAENEQRMQEMRQENAQVQEQLRGLQQLQTDLSRMQTENQDLEAELVRIKTVAGDSLAISKENQELKQQLEESRTEQRTLVDMNKRLDEESDQHWFMIGAGVIILGMLIGLAIPKIQWRQRRSSMGGINIDM